MITDADIEMAELAEMADMGRNGVCAICTEALEPGLPKWAKSYTSPRYTQAMAAEAVGPVHPSEPYHVLCMRDRGWL